MKELIGLWRHSYPEIINEARKRKTNTCMHAVWTMMAVGSHLRALGHSDLNNDPTIISDMVRCIREVDLFTNELLRRPHDNMFINLAAVRARCAMRLAIGESGRVIVTQALGSKDSGVADFAAAILPHIHDTDPALYLLLKQALGGGIYSQYNAFKAIKSAPVTATRVVEELKAAVRARGMSGDLAFKDGCEAMARLYTYDCCDSDSRNQPPISLPSHSKARKGWSGLRASATRQAL
jgi:hypothetical protein